MKVFIAFCGLSLLATVILARYLPSEITSSEQYYEKQEAAATVQEEIAGKYPFFAAK